VWVRNPFERLTGLNAGRYTVSPRWLSFARVPPVIPRAAVGRSTAGL
jgi:hypothetical protein